ncbi:MAG: ribosome biogenesis GTPase Der, partial [Actinomycetota bacterium]|nr:ribosome biogenesis GTPase Der [Actinomycetota bacterium]
MSRGRASGLPVVAVVGRPNVGKSSLVNRVLGRREAIVQEMPGVTRDRRGFVADWAGRTFEIMDTGGLEPGVEGLDARVAEQAHVAIEIADVIVLVVDAEAGPIEDDLAVAEILRRSSKPVVVAANKVDDPRDEASAAVFYRLGLGHPHPVSALHGRGSGDFLEAVVRCLPKATSVAVDAWASIAIVGRPNVGKSSILNALLGEQRSIVDARPGTTRDPVDSYLSLAQDRTLKIIDTAGMRRQAHIKDPIEYFGFLRSRQTIPRSDAVLLVIDVAEGVAGLDQRIAHEVVEEGRACVVALNKWDRAAPEDTDRERLERDIKTKLRFLDWATVVRTSALTKRGVDRLVPALEDAVLAHRRRLPTALVNRVI